MSVEWPLVPGSWCGTFREQDARESREQVVLCSERDGGTCHHCQLHLATDVLTSGQDTDIALTSGPRGQLLTSDNVTLTVSAMLWHFSAPLMCPAIKIFLKWLGIYSLPVCTKCRHSKPAQPASAAQCWYERLNFLSLYTFSYCSKIYLLAEPGNFWSDEKSCFVAFYVAGWKKYCVYWMLKNNAIPKYLDYTISQSRLILLRPVLSHVLSK